MIIQKLDTKRMLITLDESDLEVFNINTAVFSFQDGTTKMIIREILSLAAIKAGMDLKDKTLSVEALPHKNGCYILVTLKNKYDRKKYHIKKEKDYFLVRFNRSEALLDAISIVYRENLQGIKSDLYSKNGATYLLLHSNQSIPIKIKLFLSEYGHLCQCTALIRPLLEESCNIIRQNDAVSCFGKYIYHDF